MDQPSIKTYRKTFPACLENLEQMMQWIRQRCSDADFFAKESRKIELAMEEALVNIIKYAYGTVKQQEEIGLFCKLIPKNSIEFTIKDKGPPFNPFLQRSAIDLQASLDDRIEGGIGIKLMMQNMDIVHYERQEPYNILILKKNYIPKIIQ